MLSIGRRSGSVFALIALFAVVACLQLAIRNQDLMALVMALLLVALLALQYLLIPVLFLYVDRYLMIIINMLVVIGVVLQYRLDPATAFRQLQWLVAGLTAMVVVMAVVSGRRGLEGGAWLYMAVGLGLLGINFLFGTVVGGSLNWIKFENFSIQPSEFAKVTLVFSLAAVLRERRRFGGYLLLFSFVAASVLLLVAQKDLGAAALYYITFMILLFIATTNLLWTAAGALAAVFGSVGAYSFFGHVRLRVQVWLDPWATPDTGGYQIIQGLIAIASGGLLGTGLGMGMPQSIPAQHNDYIFAVACEEMGLIMGVMIILAYLILVVRGALIARAARDTFHSLLAMGATVMIAVQSFINIGGVIKLIPLTGITLPLVSYGGSSMLGTLMLCGILQAVAHHNGMEAERQALPEPEEEAP